jgi:hypothetical protein
MSRLPFATAAVLLHPFSLSAGIFSVILTVIHRRLLSYIIHSHYLLGSYPSSLPSSIVIAIIIVHPQFKRNTYLSLLCDWIFL